MHQMFAIVAAGPWARLTISAVAVAMTGVTLAAHHGTSITYFVDKTIAIEGVVTEVVYGYPHPQVYFDVKKDGKVEECGVSVGTRPSLVRNHTAYRSSL